MKIRLDIEWNVAEQPEMEEQLISAGTACLKEEGISFLTSVHLLVTDNQEIHQINLEYRQVDRPTDVLSFPSTNARPGHPLGKTPEKLRREMDETGACFLGDIVLSLPKAEEQAAAYGHSVRREVTYLFVHAMFHLLGYDHMQPEDKLEMRAKEEKVMLQLGISRVTDEELLEAARQAMNHSYSPYSHFRVGAAILTKNGEIFTGCNIENASYGVTCCAERTALFKAVSEGQREFSTIAIASDDEAPWPCGICRQALNEFAPDLRVMVTWKDRVEQAMLEQLLPHSFGPQSMAADSHE